MNISMKLVEQERLSLSRETAVCSAARESKLNFSRTA